jgi:ABC-2 type transport system ATP-binding protein
LGGTKQAMIYGTITEQQHQKAKEAGLELGVLSLQQLFIYFTEEGNAYEIR